MEEDRRARSDANEEVKVEECSVEQVGIRGSDDELLLGDGAGQIYLANPSTD